MSTSATSAGSQPVGSNVLRPRNRRPDNGEQRHVSPLRSQLNSGSAGPCRSNDGARSFMGASRSSMHSRPTPGSKNAAAGHDIAQFLGDAWSQSWTSVQALASALTLNGTATSRSPRPPQNRPRLRSNSRSGAWGPMPPSRPPAAPDIAAGSRADRDAALRVAKTASVLESHEGVNGGLDVSGKHKRRKSDEFASPEPPQSEEQLVYIHNVQPNDTYAGIVLRYKCHEDVFRKSNRLWSRDSVQMRKWLILPVDACEIKARPCAPPSWQQDCEVDLLAPTPSVAEDSTSNQRSSGHSFFDEHHSSVTSAANNGPPDSEDSSYPWTHVRWVQIDSFAKPVQIACVSRQSLGYFPPRRKRSVRTAASSLTTPRESLDLSSLHLGSDEHLSPHRLHSTKDRASTSDRSVMSSSRIESHTADRLPTWMRRPGGVGSMGKNIREPGPDKDFFNSWAKKHLPSLAVDEMPSMSVMGSESARFGFGQAPSSIVESPFQERGDMSSLSRQGSGLDRAAAAVEHWLRGALAKAPSTPRLGSRLNPAELSLHSDTTDLIELADANNEEDRKKSSSILTTFESTARDDGSATLRGRNKRDVYKKDD